MCSSFFQNNSRSLFPIIWSNVNFFSGKRKAKEVWHKNYFYDRARFWSSRFSYVAKCYLIFLRFEIHTFLHVLNSKCERKSFLKVYRKRGNFNSSFWLKKWSKVFTLSWDVVEELVITWNILSSSKFTRSADHLSTYI